MKNNFGFGIVSMLVIIIFLVVAMFFSYEKFFNEDEKDDVDSVKETVSYSAFRINVRLTYDALETSSIFNNEIKQAGSIADYVDNGLMGTFEYRGDLLYLCDIKGNGLMIERDTCLNEAEANGEFIVHIIMD